VGFILLNQADVMQGHIRAFSLVGKTVLILGFPFDGLLFSASVCVLISAKTKNARQKSPVFSVFFDMRYLRIFIFVVQKANSRAEQSRARTLRRPPILTCQSFPKM